ncbi:MAG TPA: hypothetical protein VE951_07480, partial [Candidatus Angelobacter sp.]|nr:hypothetical protein [Candidatus Angelobacter sp.]
MTQRSSRGHRLFARRLLAALLTACGLSLSTLPGIPVVAASNNAHLDRQVLKAMAAGKTLPVIVVARGNLDALHA